MSANRYDTDLVLWAEQQPETWRAAAGTGSDLPIDRDNVAGEIGALGWVQGRELASPIATIPEHLIKLQAFPTTDARIGWKEIVRRPPAIVDLVLADAAAGLRQTIPAVTAKSLPKARKLVPDTLVDYGETPRVGVGERAHTEAEILGDWFPP